MAHRLINIVKIIGNKTLRILESICKVNGVIGVVIYGSIPRGDYVNGLSDINIAIIASQEVDTRNLWSLLSSDPRISPLLLQLDKLKDMCIRGDLLCHNIFKESLILCGDDRFRNLSIYYSPRVTSYTIAQAKNLALNTLSLAIEGYIQGDKNKTLRNAYHSLRYTITYYSTRTIQRVPLKDSDMVNTCVRIAPSNLCKFFNEIRGMRNTLQQLRLAELETLLHILATSLKVTIPPISSIMLALRNLDNAKLIALRIKNIDEHKPYGSRAHYVLISSIPSKNRVVEVEVSWNGIVSIEEK